MTNKNTADSMFEDLYNQSVDLIKQGDEKSLDAALTNLKAIKEAEGSYRQVDKYIKVCEAKLKDVRTKQIESAKQAAKKQKEAEAERKRVAKETQLKIENERREKEEKAKRDEAERIQKEHKRKVKKIVIVLSIIVVVAGGITGAILGVRAAKNAKYDATKAVFTVTDKTNGVQKTRSYTTLFDLTLQNNCDIGLKELDGRMLITDYTGSKTLWEGTATFTGDMLPHAKSYFVDLELETSTNEIWGYDLDQLNIKWKLTDAMFSDYKKSTYSGGYVSIHDATRQ